MLIITGAMWTPRSLLWAVGGRSVVVLHVWEEREEEERETGGEGPAVATEV